MVYNRRCKGEKNEKKYIIYYDWTFVMGMYTS